MKTLSLILLVFISINANVKGEETMGIAGDLFGKQPKIMATSQMLDEDQFWNIIKDSLQNSDEQETQEAYLIGELQKLTPREIIGFRLRTDKLLYDTYNSEMWAAAYIMNGGCSDDCFEYFRLWIVSRGIEVYQKAMKNPDSLVSEVVNGQDYYEFESLWYVALTAFKKNTGKELYDYIDYDNFKFREGKYPTFEFNWQEDKPETMLAICPQLYNKLWK